MNYDIIDSNTQGIEIKDKDEGNIRFISIGEIVKAMKLLNNLQSHILTLTEELASSPSTQLRYLLEEFVRIRDE